MQTLVWEEYRAVYPHGKGFYGELDKLFPVKTTSHSDYFWRDEIEQYAAQNGRQAQWDDIREPVKVGNSCTDLLRIFCPPRLLISGAPASGKTFLLSSLRVYLKNRMPSFAFFDEYLPAEFLRHPGGAIATVQARNEDEALTHLSRKTGCTADQLEEIQGYVIMLSTSDNRNYRENGYMRIVPFSEVCSRLRNVV